MNYSERLKIVMLGGTNVGKTSIVQRYIKGEFKVTPEPTLGVSFFSQRLILNNTNVLMEIWDTAGQERYRSLVPMYYRNSDIIIIVYDSVNQLSFLDCKYWINTIKKNGKQSPILIVCNKIDMNDDDFGGEQFAKDNGYYFKKVSAKSGEGIYTLFNDACKQYLTDKPKNDICDAINIENNVKLNNNENNSFCQCYGYL